MCNWVYTIHSFPKATHTLSAQPPQPGSDPGHPNNPNYGQSRSQACTLHTLVVLTFSIHQTKKHLLFLQFPKRTPLVTKTKHPLQSEGFLNTFQFFMHNCFPSRRTPEWSLNSTFHVILPYLHKESSFQTDSFQS